MNVEQSKRLVNAENFKWVEGMLAYIPVDDEWIPVRLTPPIVETWNRNNVKDCLPSIDDPATIGCMLHLAEEQIDIESLIDYLEGPQETNVA